MDRKDNGLVLIHEPCIMPVMISFASFFSRGAGRGVWELNIFCSPLPSIFLQLPSDYLNITVAEFRSETVSMQ